jgi:protein SCO1/2
MSLKNKSILVTAAVLAMSAGFWLSSMQQQEETDSAKSDKEAALAEARKAFSPIQGSILSPARKIVVPALIKAASIKDSTETFTMKDLTGHWSLLFFGYTHCPDICPVTMGVVAQAKKIAKSNNHIFPQVVFISVDPERDQVDMLSEYVQYFDKEFIGVTGNKDFIKALTLQMSVVYMKMPADDQASDSSYLMDHSAALLLINPEGKLVAFFNPPHDPKTILKDFQTVVNQSY